MALTNVYDAGLPDGLGTLTLNLYAQGSVTVANTGGDTASQDAAGRYIWQVAEALSGLYDAEILTSGGDKVGGGAVYLRDDTGHYMIGDLLAMPALPELPQAAPPAEPTLFEAIALIYMAMRNKITQTASEFAVYNDAGTKIAKKAASDDGITYTEEEMTSGA